MRARVEKRSVLGWNKSSGGRKGVVPQGSLSPEVREPLKFSSRPVPIPKDHKITGLQGEDGKCVGLLVGYGLEEGNPLKKNPGQPLSPRSTTQF